MSHSNVDEKPRVNTNVSTRPDLDGEEWRDGAFYKPISARAYFKLLGYCLAGLVAVGLFLILLSRFTG